MTPLTFLLCVLGSLQALEVIPERPELEYYNRKYLRFMSLTIRRKSRRSPYFIDLELDSNVGVGNNLTVKMAMLEYLGGHYHPTPLQRDYKLCDFLYKEPFLGQMYAKQLPGNWTCPFPAGEYHFKDLVIHLENFPHDIPFTWHSSISVKTRADVQGFLTTTNEEIFRWKTYVTVTQKPKKGNDNKKNKDKTKNKE